MPVRWSQTLIPTSRQVPADAEVPSHQLMLRAGFIRKLGAGMYDYLPAGLRSLQKVMAIIREEMAIAGAIEVLLPTLAPIELFQKTGRDTAYGDNLFRVVDRHGRHQALGPTHEEVVTELVGAYVESYRQLPLTLYQIQTKFRDEFRPRFGVLRSREFQMKDAYSFHTKVEGEGGLNETYQAQYDAYCRIFSRCGLPYEIVEAEAGPIGGSASHEFMVPSPTGEDTILKSDKGNYAANVEKCEIGDRQYTLEGEPTGELDKVHTPGCATIEDVSKFMKVKPKNMLKSMVFVAIKEGDNPDPTQAKEPWYIIAIVRGDHDINEAKLRDHVAARLESPVSLEMAPEALARKDGFAIGFVGPHAANGRDDAHLFVDIDVAQAQFWASGANEVDHHVKHFDWQRDVSATVNVADIRNAVAGDPSPKNDGGVLEETKGIEIGHVFKLGCKYSDALGVSVLDENQQQQSLIMGCYGIGVNRILAGVIEREGGHDENGIIWPSAIAPYQVLITTIKYEGQMKEVANQLAGEIEKLRSPTQPQSFFHPDVLIDDRDERPGVKFKDADLIGIPMRITIGDKALKDGNVEVKPRNAKDAEMVPIGEAAARVVELLAGL